MNKEKIQEIEQLQANREKMRQTIEGIDQSLLEIFLRCDHTFPNGKSSLDKIDGYKPSYYCSICRQYWG